jgi:hypothetical protein
MTEARKLLATLTRHYGAIETAFVNLSGAALYRCMSHSDGSDKICTNLRVLAPTEVLHGLKFLAQQQSVVP